MRIKTILHLNAIVPGVVAMIIGAVLWAATYSVNQARQDAEVAEKVLQINFELSILTQEYLLYGGARVEKQIQIHHKTMGDLLKSLEFEVSEEQELLASMRRSHEALGSFYDLLLQGKPDARDQLVGVLLVKVQDMRAKTRQFATIQYQQALHLQSQANAVVIAVIVVTVFLTLIVLATTSRRLTRGLDRLSEGMQRVASGDLSHHVESNSFDELNLVGQSFNAMSQKLGSSYTSIEALRIEVERRIEAERSLALLNTELEGRVNKRTADLESANRELEAFSYSVSHDLRAPLRAIDGFSRKMAKNYGDQLDDEGRRILQVLRDNAQRMGQLIDDLLAFSRMGRREMLWQPIEMEATVRSIAQELCALERLERTIKITVLTMPQASGDTAMIRQVWANLLGNAIKFTRNRDIALIEVGGRKEGDEVLYWVKDNGAGFDMQYAGKLFGVFQRLHRQDEFEGTGVGLAIAQRIVHRHNGRIWGEGQPDGGATFWFSLAFA